MAPGGPLNTAPAGAPRVLPVKPPASDNPAPVHPPANVGAANVAVAPRPPATQASTGFPSPSVSAPRQEQSAVSTQSTSLSARNSDKDSEFVLNDLLVLVVEKKGSDLHLTVGSPPMMRLQGQLWPTDLPPLTAKDTQRLIFDFLNNDQRERFERDLELDISYEIHDVSRYRCNIFQNRLGVGGVFRVIPSAIKSLADLKMPPVLTELSRRNKGLVLVTGPTGSGKSTTLAAMVDQVNSERQDHILTIEDPIEFVHQHKRCIVNQRELGVNTKSFANALRAALREDPDVILVGELRDYETISLAVTAAETGHLVFATLHTPSAAQSVDRIVDVFPSHQQAQIRTQLADALQGIIAQQLIPTLDGMGRAVALEILVNVPAVANLIRENKTFQIISVLQTSKQLGMQTMDQALMDLMKSRRISSEDAYRRAFDKKAFEQYKPRV
ncbi:MAG: PilT/PilU family type 4a pilus ATPase [Candidatus Riflebacteria bacterium]|nr:PilT/PilU family type 4a pilus ATPase [Candidatus Riflebacteria bacterium]